MNFPECLQLQIPYNTGKLPDSFIMIDLVHHSDVLTNIVSDIGFDDPANLDIASICMISTGSAF